MSEKISPYQPVNKDGTLNPDQVPRLRKRITEWDTGFESATNLKITNYSLSKNLDSYELIVEVKGFVDAEVAGHHKRVEINGNYQVVSVIPNVLGIFINVANGVAICVALARR